MESIFVPLNIAKILKEKGYNKPALACYDKLDMLSTYSKDVFKPKNYNNSGYCCSAPLYQQVIDWFRESHHIHVAASSFPVYNGKYGIQYSRSVISSGWQPESDTYYDALNKAIEEALKLI